MKMHICYFCNYKTNNKTHFKNHIFKKKKCSYLISDLNIKSIEHYNSLVELHKNEPNNQIFGIDYTNKPKPVYYDSEDEEEKNDDEIMNEKKKFYYDYMDKMVHNKKYYCEFCNKRFSRNDSMKRHVITCKEKLKQENLLLKQENQTLKNNSNSNRNQSADTIYNAESMKNQSAEVINNADTINNINIQNLQLCLNNYGSENKDIFLDEKYLLDWFEQPFNAIPNIIKKLHFCPKSRPENTNIRINNISNNKIQIFKNEWKTKMKKEIVKDLIKNLGDELIEKYEDLVEEGKIKKKDYSNFHIFKSKFQSYYLEEDSFDELNEELGFMKQQEQQVDCILIDCCINNKNYLKSL